MVAYFVTRSAIALEELGITNSFRECSHPRNEFISHPKGVIGNSTQTGPVLGVLVTLQFGRYNIEVTTGSLARGGSISWVVMSRRVERYVTESSLDGTESPYRNLRNCG